MYGTRFRRRGVLRPETTPGGRSRRRLLMRPVAYAILAAVVCVAAATLPSAGKNDQARAAAGHQSATASSSRPATWRSSSSRSRSPSATRARSRAILMPGTPVNPDPTRRPGLLPGADRPDADQIPDALTSYGLRTVDGSCNNLIPGRRERSRAADQPFPRLTTPVFRAAEAVPAGSSVPAAGTIPSSSYAQKQGIVVRLAAAHDHEPDRRPDVDQPGRGRGGRGSRCAPRANPGVLRVRPIRGARRHRRLRARSTRRCSSRTSRPTSACRRRTTRCSRSSASSSTTASTRPSRAAAPCSCR